MEWFHFLTNPVIKLIVAGYAFTTFFKRYDITLLHMETVGFVGVTTQNY